MSPTLSVVSRTRPEGLLKVALSLTRLWPDGDDYVCVCVCGCSCVRGGCLFKEIHLRDGAPIHRGDRGHKSASVAEGH